MTDREKKANERNRKGKRAAAIGIVANALMFAAKLAVGVVSSSGAVLADSVNSLSDSLTGIVNFFGFYLSDKPADRDHPFGHGRIEYISSLLISCVIILAGYEFLVRSIKGILRPVSIVFEPFMAFVLSVTILMKIGMFIYYRRVSKRIKSESIRGASLDSISDVAITSVALAGLIVSSKTDWMIDSYIGVVVSLVVMISGFSSAKSSVSYIIGKEADPEIVRSLTEVITKHVKIEGVHDVAVHDYGPGRQVASAHVEISSDMSLKEAHQVVSDIEERVFCDLNIPITIHVDLRS
ncbi:MAG: cation transporter [Clostridiaceae bacterium]|nr:cation transporter [Clostridiaceae bacterium]